MYSLEIFQSFKISRLLGIFWHCNNKIIPRGRRLCVCRSARRRAFALAVLPVGYTPALAALPVGYTLVALSAGITIACFPGGWWINGASERAEWRDAVVGGAFGWRAAWRSIRPRIKVERNQSAYLSIIKSCQKNLLDGSGKPRVRHVHNEKQKSLNFGNQLKEIKMLNFFKIVK